jgi:hypothetical protein
MDTGNTKVFGILGHPGHELLILQFLADHDSRVAVLTDGSGGAMADRRAWSKEILRARGCQIDSLFGHAADRKFYDAILHGEASFLEPIIDRLCASVAEFKPSLFITDSIEYFNPVHDLANVLTDLVIARVRPWWTFEKLVYAIEYPAKFPRYQAAYHRPLDPRERQLKAEAAQLYQPLESEVLRLRQAGKLGYLEEELFFVDPIRAGLIEPPARTRFESAYYEDYGRKMVEAGRYKEVLTFAGHFQPLVQTLFAATGQGAGKAG